MIGRTLSHYKIVDKLGSGGMGEVYRAEDTKLGREVAIKVLPEAFRQDEERLARFQREARALAALNHPNIGTLYGLESDDDITYLVMELVPGDTLEERLRRGPLAIDEAIGIFQQIADALEAAHAAGIVHRDLKPANIKITPEGRVKVLDFGLAKAFAVEEPVTDLSQSPTLTRNATVAGVILGTASYMSPEQAKGKTVDKRTDIWAFGCVLFEAIAGRKAYDGESVTDVLANVIHKDVAWDALPAETPWRVRDVLRRCLTKDLQHRFHDVADVRIELTEETENVPTSEARPAASPWRVVAVGVLAALMAIASAALFFGREAPPAGGVQRFVITPPHEDPPLQLQTPVLSRDGRRIVYVGAGDNDTRLYVRELDEIGSRVIEGTEDARSPFFSPDGLWVGFLSGSKLKKVSILGGAPIDIIGDAWSGGPGGAWPDDDTIWFSRNWISGLLEVSADGGEAVPVTTPDPERGEVGHWWPDFLPDGQTALFTVFTDEGTHQIAALDLKTKTWRHLFPGMQAQYVSSGHIVYYWAGIYQAVSFDPSRLEIRGTAVPVLKNTRGIGPTGNDDRYFDMSDTGIVVTIPGGASYPRSILAWLGRDGSIEPLPFDSAAIRGVRLDPRGARVALAREDGGIYNVWLYDLEFGSEERLTRDANNFNPQWTPDGRRIVFTTARRGQYDVFSKPVDGLGPEEPVVDRDDVDESASAVSPNGRWLALVEYAETGQDLAVVNLDDGSAPIPVGRSPFDQGAASFSRDSAWIAFYSFASGRSEVYVQQVVDGTGRVRVSSAGGMRPVWSPVEDELYYVSGDTVMAVRYRVAQGEFRAETPRALVNLPERHRANGVLEMSPDGERFLILIETGEDPSPTELHVTTNWLSELKRLAPVDE